MDNISLLLSKLNKEETIELLYHQWLHHIKEVGEYANDIMKLHTTRRNREGSRNHINQLIHALYHKNLPIYEEALELFPFKLALEPHEMEGLLGITKLERMRWTKEGKLPVLEIVVKIRFGKRYEYPRYDRKLSTMISKEDITNWRIQREEQKKENFRQGAYRAIERKKQVTG